MNALFKLLCTLTLPVLFAACAATTTAPAPTAIVLKPRPAVVLQSAVPMAVQGLPVATPIITQVGTVSTAQLPLLQGQDVLIAPIGVATLKRSYARDPGFSGLFLFRDGQGSSEPLSIFINGHYLSTLKPNSWSHVQVCPGEYVVQLVPQSALLADKRQLPSTAMSVGQANTDYFMQMRHMPNGNPIVARIERDKAQAMLHNYAPMNHTVARLKPHCDAQAVTPASTAVQRYALSAEVLFDLGKWHLNPANMAQVRAMLDNIVKDIRQQNLAIARMEITGHTDPVGSATANQALSLRRAAEVARYLQRQGLAKDRMLAKGMGETQLLDSECAQKFNTPARFAQCNEVNRRVEIAVYIRN